MMNHSKIADIATELHHGNVSIADLAIAIRLEFANNWLSVGNCAAANEIPVDMAERLLTACRDIHEYALTLES